MKKKIWKIVISSSTGLITLAIIIIVPVLMLLDFFGVNVTDGYVENNMAYSEMYIDVVKKKVTSGKGYVSLDRILYFYLVNDNLTFEQIYDDNLDEDLKQVKPISEVCLMNRYSIYSVCDEEEIKNSNQINDIQNKPFSSPLDFNKLNVTSYFMQERIIYDKYNIHQAWDFGAEAKTPVYSVCDGTVVDVSFTYENNIIDINGGAGNQIVIKCKVDDITYEVLYGHLFPKSAKVKIGDEVKKWQKIGEVGTTGYSTGNHLHYQVSKDGKTIDGLSLIDFTNINKNPLNNFGKPENGQINGQLKPWETKEK